MGGCFKRSGAPRKGSARLLGCQGPASPGASLPRPPHPIDSRPSPPRLPRVSEPERSRSLPPLSPSLREGPSVSQDKCHLLPGLTQSPPEKRPALGAPGGPVGSCPPPHSDRSRPRAARPPSRSRRWAERSPVYPCRRAQRVERPPEGGRPEGQRRALRVRLPPRPAASANASDRESGSFFSSLSCPVKSAPTLLSERPAASGASVSPRLLVCPRTEPRPPRQGLCTRPPPRAACPSSPGLLRDADPARPGRAGPRGTRTACRGLGRGLFAVRGTRLGGRAGDVVERQTGRPGEPGISAPQGAEQVWSDSLVGSEAPCQARSRHSPRPAPPPARPLSTGGRAAGGETSLKPPRAGPALKTEPGGPLLSPTC